MFNPSETTSRVVPALLLTIALFFPTKRLKIEDFPAFVFPAKQTRSSLSSEESKKEELKTASTEEYIFFI